jgi:hypothetical protein
MPREKCVALPVKPEDIYWGGDRQASRQARIPRASPPHFGNR